MAVIITVDDLPTELRSHEMVDFMVAGANAKASRVAPCLSEAPTEDQIAEARLVLLGAVKRWAEAGSGALASQTAGPFGQTIDTRQRTGYHLWPSEITDLQGICSSGTPSREAFSIDTAPAYSSHLPWCSLSMGAAYCSCGADIAGEPIYELG
jgi:hypothetical protein